MAKYFSERVKILAKQTLIYGLGTIVPRFLNYGILTFLYTRIFDKKVHYNMKRIIPYFIIAISMVIFAKFFHYPGLISEFLINTLLIILFVMYAQYKDQILAIFFGREIR